MKIIKLLLILVCATTLSNAQTSTPQAVHEQTNVELIGLKHIAEHGTIILSKGSKRSIRIQRLDTSLQELWNTNITLEKAKGYSFHKAEIYFSNDRVYLCDHFGYEVKAYVFDMITGKFISSKLLASDIATELDRLPIAVIDNKLSLLHFNKKQAVLITLDHELEVETKDLQTELPYTAEDHLFFDSRKEVIHSYEVEKDHSELTLKLISLDLFSRDTTVKEHILSLDHTAFTYNSIVDNRLMSFYPMGDELYAVGKLDHRFKGSYPQARNSEAFLGFWIAKFNKQLDLVYFSEIPFQYFEGLVTNDMVVKAAVLDLKEDLNGSVFVSINEMKGVLYGKKYVVNLDRTGQYTTFIGGQDAYHFFEYNDKGLRRTANKLKLRLMNDDLGFYSNSYLHLLKYSPNHHSEAIQSILQISSKQYVPYSDKIYSFHGRKNDYLIMEYLDKKSGSLNIYRVPK